MCSTNKMSRYLKNIFFCCVTLSATARLCELAYPILCTSIVYCTILIETAAACCSCRSGRGEALLSFRRAPRGLALRRCRAGVTTQQRLRSPPPGMLGPRPSLLMIAAKTPSQCTMHASERTRDRAPLRVQKPSAPLHNPPPTRMPKASE